MNELEYADAYLAPYRQHGDEIIPTYCPFCQGGNHKDKYTFALNVANHTYNCQRGSCGARGHFSQLLKAVGETFEDDATPYIPRKTYVLPKTVYNPPTNPAIEYCKARGFGETTIKAFRLGTTDGDVIVFPYFRTAEDATPTFIKYRPSHKIEKGQRKMWREANTEPILYNLWNCSPDRYGRILYMTEGEFDCMAVWQAFEGNVNVTSVPSGCTDWEWCDTCKDILSQYKYLYVVGDADDAGRKMIEEIARKYSDTDLIIGKPNYDKYLGCKDMNELLVRYGHAEVITAVTSVRQIPPEGLLNFPDIILEDLTRIPKTRTGIAAFDKVFGGFLAGDLTVWTGKRGNGKSTVLGQILLQAVNDGASVCIYSGEVPAQRLKQQLLVQAAGYLYLNTISDPTTGRAVTVAKPEVVPLIEQWLDKRLWIYDNNVVTNNEAESIAKTFSMANRRYNCSVFLVDNLMCIQSANFKGDFYLEQAEYVKTMRRFAADKNVHVHMVVHPRKTKNSELEADDVGGLGTITNIACNVINVSRLDEDKNPDGKNIVKLSVMKNRAFGENCETELDYEPRSRRFTKFENETIHFAWERLLMK